MKKRILSLVLCLVMVFSLLPFFGMSVLAADANGITNPDPAQDATKALNLTKELSPGEDGAYDITMTSWATGEVQAVTEKIPTDFVVVVDQSGSMSTTDMPTGDPKVANNLNLETVANGTYYYKDGDNYYRVYGVKDYLYRYIPANSMYVGDIVDYFGTRLRWFMKETDTDETTTNFKNVFYFREVVDGKTHYQPIKTTVQGKIGAYVMYFEYQSKKTGQTVQFNRDDTTYSTNGNSPWFHKAAGGGVENSGADWRALKAHYDFGTRPKISTYMVNLLGLSDGACTSTTRCTSATSATPSSATAT